MKVTACILVILAVSSPALAELKWDKKEWECFPAINDTAVKAEFNFTNTGRDAVTITSVEPGCGCTTASLEKTTFQPGERGHITAVFTLGDRSGLQTKPIRVSIKGEEQITTLSIVAHIPETLKVSPQLVVWQSGDKPQAKTIELVSMRDDPIRVTRVTSSDPAMTVVLQTVKPGKTYRVVVTPAQTANSVAAVVTIEADVAPNVHQVFTAHAHVKPSRAEPEKIFVYQNGQALPPETKK